MDTPKVSILIPLYNRIRYAEECIKSALNQTFQDTEVVIRDDCSTDGVFDFVREKFSEQISSGKIKLFRNEKNLGEGGTIDKLFHDASGKYVHILHNDDLLLPNASQHLYEVAEKFQADVVHGSNFLIQDKDEPVTEGTPLRPVTGDQKPVAETTVMPSDPLARFTEWNENGTFLDAQYNLFRRDFLLENKIFMSRCRDLSFFLLLWIMKAGVYVKDPTYFYIRRDAKDSKSNTFSARSIEKFIVHKLKVAEQLDKVLPEIKFFTICPQALRLAKLKILANRHDYTIKETYKDGVTPEIQAAVENAFRQKFGDAAFYPAMLFNWVHVLPTEENISTAMIKSHESWIYSKKVCNSGLQEKISGSTKYQAR